MAGLVDGMGGEEVNQEVTTTEIISGANVYGSTSVEGAAVSNTDGLLKSVSTGSPAVYNGMVQTGTITLSAGSEADVEFGVPFSSKKYGMTFGMSGAATSATLPTISGVMTSSGLTVIGDASATYYYIAAGY